MPTAARAARPLPWFTLFKYVIYALLTLNIVLFFFDDWSAARAAYGDDFSSISLIALFPSTVDTAAWVVLLLLFELETWVISDDTLSQRRVQYSLMATRALAGSVIVYAFYGYWLTLLNSYAVTPLAAPEQLCALAERGYQQVISLGEFTPLDSALCASQADANWLLHNRELAVGSAENWLLVQRLAWLDMINSGAWLLVVVVLEGDVWLQLRGRLNGLLLTISRYTKLVLYLLLAVAVVCWIAMGDWLDGWDAAIWLIAFVFIELNLFRWQAETAEPVPVGAG